MRLDKRAVGGTVTAVTLFLILRGLDFGIAGSMANMPWTDYAVGAQMRVSMSLCVAAAVGSYISRGRSLYPVLLIVVITWLGAAVEQYINRTDYEPTIRIRDLDWVGTFLAIIVVVVGTRLGEWIRKEKVNAGPRET